MAALDSMFALLPIALPALISTIAESLLLLHPWDMHTHTTQNVGELCK